MKILITGAKGFIGKNFISELNNQGYSDIFEYDIDSDISFLRESATQCDFVFHLAGVNRPQDPKEFMEGNYGLTTLLLNFLSLNEKKPSILCTSSIQATLENPYGQSKKAAEDEIFAFGNKNGNRVFIYRLQNVFGKWCRPNYNSVVATFCNNIANNLPIQVSDPNNKIQLVYIDDVMHEFILALKGQEHRNNLFCEVPTFYSVTLGEIVKLLESFKNSRANLFVPLLADGFEKKLYSTYLSYLAQDDFAYNLKMNKDERGSFTEFIKSPDRGQVSINAIKPGFIKGNHWHHSKNEKFLTVSGKGVIQLRKIDSDNIIEYKVSGEELIVVDIPCGYTHNIINTSDTDMITLIWVNEIFDKEYPDTYYLQV